MKPNRNRNVALLLLIFYLAVFQLNATAKYYFFVQFSNKNNSPYSLSNPADYLSERAITRRTSFGISCDSTDLPVNPTYISRISNLGISVHNRSKWLNGITVLVSDSSVMSQVRALYFVRKVQYTGKIDMAFSAKSQKLKSETTTLNYGTAATQISQVNGVALHDAGYKGKGMLIGVLDAGFNNANINPAFDSLRLQGRLWGIKNIAEPDSNVYKEDAHGANVLSIMTGNLPGQYLGAAPEASFWLIRTEYAPTEYLVETDFWASGIEFADSVGVDVVNSSLGYTQFDDASMNFTYADMNGIVSRASIAAHMASQKGIVVCNSAGNDGNKTWHYIGSPADADGILSIGAVTSTGTGSAFTSYGPTSDLRIKPEACAMGSSTAFVNINGIPSSGNGTSYSSPIMTALTACLLQRYKAFDPHPSIDSLVHAIIRSGSLYSNPTGQLGYGIPDFGLAVQNLPKTTTFGFLPIQNDIAHFKVMVSNNKIFIHQLNNNNYKLQISIFASNGVMVYHNYHSENQFYLPLNLTNGIYIVQVTDSYNSEVYKLIMP